MQNQSDDVDMIEKNINRILKAGKLAPLDFYLAGNQKRMREAMRNIMSESYCLGSNDCHKVIKGLPR
jgi:hypothetical protein